MKNKLLIIIVAILIFINNIFLIDASAETLIIEESFDKVSIEDGLSNENVTTIFQDSKGYIWIGTEDGLNRFDGEKIKIYNCNSQNNNSLSSTYINDIEEDDFGNIWVATDFGLDCILTDSDTVIRMKDIEEDIYNLGELKITSILKSSIDKNVMWIGTDNGLIEIDVEDFSVKAFYHDEDNENSLTNSSITCLKESLDGSLWIGTKNGINIINKDYKIINKQPEIFDGRLYIYNIDIDKYNNAWISTKEGIILYNLDKEKTESILVVDNIGIKKQDSLINKGDNINEIHNNKFILIDSKNNAWISSSDGVIKYSIDNSKSYLIRNNKDYSNSLSSDMVTCFYEDINGTIWIGTEKGVNILNSHKQFNNSNYQNYLNNKSVVSILEHNGYIWIATKFDGIYIYEKKTSTCVERLYKNESGLDLTNQYIKSLHKLNDEWIIAITNLGIVSFNLYEDAYDFHLSEGGYASEFNYIYSDEETIWIATTSELKSYSLKTGLITVYSDILREEGINPGGIKSILPDYKDKDVVWIGGINTGLVKFHKIKGVLEHYSENPNDESSLLRDYITCMNFDSYGNLWVGTDVGLGRLNTETKSFKNYTLEDGLTNHYINGILFDNYNNPWVSTNKGLNKIDRLTDKIINFTKFDGLYGYQFNLNSHLKLEDGYMLFGSTEGCTYFNYKDIIIKPMNKNKVVIGDIYVSKNKTVYDGKELVLQYNEKDLVIEYFLPIYEELESISYEYMIEELDKDWIYLEGDTSLNLKSLDAGKYVLKLRARDSRGELTEETTMNITVKSEPWKTPLAITIYILIIISIILFMLNYVNILRRLVAQKTIKLRNQLKENQKLTSEIIRREKSKNRYFINLSHELRTPINVISATVQLINTLVKDGTYISKEKFTDYMKTITNNSKNLLKVVNDMIDTSKIEAGYYKINTSNNDIVYIVEETALNMSGYIEEEGLSLVIDPDIEEKVIACDPTEIERCIMNLLSNSTKFTPRGGKIGVFIKEVKGFVEITIEDNGIGIPKEYQEVIFDRFLQVDDGTLINESSSGIGLAIVKHIVELHGGYVRVESEVKKGSKFTIALPDKVLEEAEGKPIKE